MNSPPAAFAAHDRTSAGASTNWPGALTAYAAGVVAAAYFAKIAPALPLIRQEFGLSLIGAGWLVSAFNLLGVTTAVFVGTAADRIGALRFCAAGLVLLAAGAAAGALAGGPGLLIAARIVEGSGFVAIVVSAPALVAAAAAPADRALALGCWASYMPAGAALAMLAGAGTLPVAGWRGLWWLGVAAAAAALVMLLRLRASYAAPPGAARRSLAVLRGTVTRPQPWALGIAFAMYTLQWHAVMMWLPTYAQENYVLGEGTAALVTALYVVINVAGNLGGGLLLHRGARRSTIIGVTFAATALLFAAMFAAGVAPPVRYALVLLYSAVTGVIAAAALSGGVRYARDASELSAMQGLIVQISQGGTFLSPLVVALAVSLLGGWNASLYVLLGAGAIGIACALAIRRMEQQAMMRAE